MAPRKGRAELLRYTSDLTVLVLCVFAFFLFQASDFGQIGLDLEAKFEKDLKELLIFHDTNENGSQSPL